MTPYMRALTLLCLALPALSADDILRFHEERSFSNQLYSQFAGNGGLLIAELPGEALEIQSLSDPLNPVVVGRIAVEQTGIGLEMVGNRVLRLTVDTLQVFDITDPAKPALMHSFSFLSGLQANRFQIVGQRVYVGGTLPDQAGFVLQTLALDASAPILSPVALQPATVPAHREWLINETHLFVSEASNLWIFDMETPTLAANRRFHETSLYRDDSRLFFYRNQVLVDAHVGMYLYNPDDVSASRPISDSFPPGGYSWMMGDLFFISNGFGYNAYDFSREGRPFVESFYFGYWPNYPIYDAARDLLFSVGIDRMGVVENPTSLTDASQTLVRIRDGLLPFDNVAPNGDLVALSSPWRVTLLRTLPEGDYEVLATLRTDLLGHKLAWFGDYLVAGGGEDYRFETTYIINVQDPKNPFTVGSFRPDALSFDGHRIARLDEDEEIVLIQDFTNPLQPQTEAVVPVTTEWQTLKGNLDNILLSGDLLLLSNLVDVAVYQRVDGRYQHVATLNMSPQFENKPYVETMMVHENKAFFGGSGVTVVDMTDPRQPIVQDTVTVDPWNGLTTRPRFVGMMGDTLFYKRSDSVFAVDFEDPDNLTLVPFALEPVSAFLVKDGVMTACFYDPDRVVSGEIGFCTPPEITGMPVDTFLCPAGSATLSTVAAGEGLLYQWYRDGELLEGANEASLTVADLQETATYVCHVTSACSTVETEAVQVIPTVCQVDQAYGLWQNDAYFCDTQNPTILNFVAALNNGGACPR